jgi:site-specific DNA recombinase
VPIAALNQRRLDDFATVLRGRLLDRSGGFSKRYLRQLFSEIRFDGKRVTMQGGKAALLGAALEKETGTARVPTSGIDWLPDQGSNLGPAD